MIKITYEKGTLTVPEGTSYRELAAMVQKDYPQTIVLVRRGAKLTELNKAAAEDETLQFITLAEREGMLAYERSALMLLAAALDALYPGKPKYRPLVKFSLINGYYAEIPDKAAVNAAFAESVKAKMRELAAADLPFTKEKMPTDKARRLFRELGQEDKDCLFRFRRSSTVNVYSLGTYRDYFYGCMLPSSGYLKAFDLVPYEAGLALLLPLSSDPGKVAEFKPQKKIFDTLQATSDWCEEMEIDTVGKLNRTISRGEIADLILMCEARQEKDVAAIATRIAAQPQIKCVMIAGPSSSGKTSFSHRLSVQLRGLGLKPQPIEVDNYFVDHKDTPLDENGEMDFEALGCVDIEKFNRDMLALLAGEEVAMPTYNFKEGKQEYRGNTLRLKAGDVLVIEGIHCLNEAMSYRIPAESKFKIYVSALTSVNIDAHNRIPTSDGRLIRRMVRDARTRGASAEDTLARWASVRRGETQNIFPYQESADAVFNSSMPYEFSVLKSYAEQLLFGIPEDSAYAAEAKRLLRFFDYFLAADSANVPQNSLIKEFIGGSIFNV